MADAKHVVDNLEALVLGGVVYGGDIGDLCILGGGVEFEEGERGEDAGGGDVDGQLVLPDGKLLHVFGQTRHEVLAVLV